MRLLADDLHFPGIGCGKGRTFRIADVANFHFRHHVQREDRLRLRVLQHAFFHHQRSPACLARRRTLLRRLKDELDCARQLTLHRGEDARNAELHRGVDIVAAGVHHSDVLAEERCPDFRGERKSGLLRHRQRIHVGADGDHRPGLPSLQDRDDSRARDAGLDLEAKLAQIVGNERRRLLLAVRELGILMNLVADLGQRRRHFAGFLVDSRQRVLRHERRRDDDRKDREQLDDGQYCLRGCHRKPCPEACRDASHAKRATTSVTSSSNALPPRQLRRFSSVVSANRAAV